MTRASDKDMDGLHGALCGYFLRLIKGEIPDGETGAMIRPGAGDLAVMAKFLKDNAITGSIVDGSDLSALEQKLADRHARRGKLPTAKDVADAMREVGSGLVQ